METTTTTTLQPIEAMILQTSFDRLEGASEPFADLFFARLFQLEPALRDLFPNDLYRVKRALMTMLAFLVGTPDRPDEWQTEVESLGRRHFGYGVEAKHYQIFGQALFWTLEKGLGEDFTFQTLRAWQNRYAELVSVMQTAPAGKDIPIIGP